MIRPASTTAATRLADFVILGAAKAGTTTLYETLRRDPRLFLSTPKEPNYFSIEHHRGLAWYADLFASARTDQLCGEASTIYTWERDTDACAARMYATIPHARLIFLLRHPVDRAYSHYREQIKAHQLEDGYEDYRFTFEQYIQRNDRVLSASDYPRKLAPYLRHFGDESLHLILFDDLLARREQAMKCVYAHLGLSYDAAAVAEPVAANVHSQFVDWYARQRVLEPLRRLPLLGQVGSALPRPVKDAVYALVRRSPGGRRRRAQLVPPPMQPQTRQALLEQFEPVVAWVEARLGQQLSAWRR